MGACTIWNSQHWTADLIEVTVGKPRMGICTVKKNIEQQADYQSMQELNKEYLHNKLQEF
jgi:hypothetical protein